MQNSDSTIAGAGSVSGASALFSMWANVTRLNLLWAGVGDDDFPFASMMFSRPPVLGGREGAEIVLRQFSRVEIISMGKTANSINLDPAREYVMYTKTLSNRGEKQIVRLTEVSLRGSRLSLLAENCYLRYRAQDQSVLSIEWEGEVDYGYFVPRGTLLPDSMPAGYVEYYDRQKKVEIALMPQPANPKLQDLYIYMHSQGMGRDKIFVFFQQPPTNESWVNETLQRLAPASEALLTGLFRSDTFPEVEDGSAPEDIAWFSHLVTPPGSLEVDKGEMTPAGWQGSYKSAASKSWSPAYVVTSESPYKIAPHSQIFHAGEDEELLGFVGTPIPGANWSVAGDAGGELVKKGNDHFYLPGKQPTGIIFSAPGDTLIPAATRASWARLPASTDVVTATGDEDVCTSVSLVTTYVYPTHFLRFAREGDALQLTCMYFNRKGDEVAVPPQDVEWHILAGNGVVSAEGLFTPAPNAPSAVTVVMAVDERWDDEWRFAVSIIPMPLLSLRDVVRLQQT